MSKCDGGIEIPMFENCPKCGAGPAGPCWVGIRQDQEKIRQLRELIAELLDDSLILEGAPPGIGWFDRAEAAIGRPTGSSFQKALAQKRKELSELARATSPLSSPHYRSEL